MTKEHRIFIIDTYYGNFLSDFYTKIGYQTTATSGYHFLKKTLLDECFGASDFYSSALNKLGCKAEEFIINDEIGQKKWALENGLHLKNQNVFYRHIPKLRAYMEKSWIYPVLEAQIKEFKPDIILNKNISFIDPILLAKIKREDRVKVIGQIASKLPDKSFFDPYDLIISSLPHYVELFKNWGIKSHYQQLAFDPKILDRIVKSKTQYNVTHIGGYGPTHNERNELLEKVAQKTKVDFWGHRIDNLRTGSPIMKNYHGSAWGMDMYNILANSKITLTKHITSVAGKYANNLTLYEATGCGCLLITDKKENLSGILKPGEEIETYASVDELAEKIKYYLNHDKERTAIAKNGQERTLYEHNYLNRMRDLIEIINKNL